MLQIYNCTVNECPAGALSEARIYRAATARDRI